MIVLNSLKEQVEDFIKMNEAGQVLALCEKYYAENVLMTSDGNVFAHSMRESFTKQKVFVDAIKESWVKLMSSEIEGNVVNLVFHYKMKNSENKIIEFTGKHSQVWQSGKITKEDYQTLS